MSYKNKYYRYRDYSSFISYLKNLQLNIAKNKESDRTMVKRLTESEINEILDLKKFVNAKRIAVENFLISTPSDLSYSYALSNVMLDRNLYKWNAQTVNAIIKGLNMMYN